MNVDEASGAVLRCEGSGSVLHVVFLPKLAEATGSVRILIATIEHGITE